MAWCHQATSHYLSQCWPRSLSPYGVSRSQWVNLLSEVMCVCVSFWMIFSAASDENFIKRMTDCSILVVELGPDDFNTLRLRQNGRHFEDNIFECIYFNENICISIKISLKFVPRGLIDNKVTLVQIMVWHRWRAIIWTNDGLVYWCIYASLGLNELTVFILITRFHIQAR